MRCYRIRFDIWLCMVLSLLVTGSVTKVVKTGVENSYEAYLEKHTVADGEIGGIAGEEVYRAQNVDDLLEHETFTVISHGSEYKNGGSGYYGNFLHKVRMCTLTLPSGERVAARINDQNVQGYSDISVFYVSDLTLPVGRVVYEDLTKDSMFLQQIEFRQPLSRTDFYVDMLGKGDKMSKEDYLTFFVMIPEFLTFIICFSLLHAIGVKFGIFPYVFAPQNKKKAKSNQV